MKIKSFIFAFILSIIFSLAAFAQEGQPGFVILLKNGSAVRGRTLTRESSGQLRLAMTESGSGEARSYAIIAVEDTESIRASSSDTDSINIKLKGGSELKCKEFSLNGDSVIVKLGSASRIEVRWEDITSISFNG
jgi:hypothetical protein